MMSGNIVEYNPLPSQLMFEEAKKWGFGDSTAQALGDLFAYMLGGDLPPETLAKWQRLNVIDADGNIMLENKGINVIEWNLIGLAWEGLVTRRVTEEDGDE